MIYLPIKLEGMTQSTYAPMMPSASRHGFFLGFALVVMQTIFYLADIKTDSVFGYLSYIILFGGLFLSVRQYRDELNSGFISYGRSVGYGVVVSLMAGIISSAFIFILYEFIDTSFLPRMLLEAEIKLEEQNLPPDQLEMALEINQKMFTPFAVSMMSILGYVFMGTLFSLVVAVFLKKEDEGFNSFNKDTN